MVGAIAAAGIGLVLLTRRGAMAKRPGEPIQAEITFQHKGPAVNVWAGWGYAQSQTVGRGPLSGWTYGVVPTLNDPTFADGQYSILVEGVIPGLGEGKYDILLFGQEEGGLLDPGGGGFPVAKWFDELLTVV